MVTKNKRMSKREEYPPNWKEIALRIKNEEKWTCQICRRKEDKKAGIRMTTDHIDGHPSNCARSNLRCLCQRCNLMHAKMTSGKAYEKKKM